MGDRLHETEAFRLTPIAPSRKRVIVNRRLWFQLVEADLSRLASPWHTDADLGRPIEVVTDMSKSRRLGFTAYQATDQAFFDLFERLRADRIIP